MQSASEIQYCWQLRHSGWLIHVKSYCASQEMKRPEIRSFLSFGRRWTYSVILSRHGQTTIIVNISADCFAQAKLDLRFAEWSIAMVGTYYHYARDTISVLFPQFYRSIDNIIWIIRRSEQELPLRMLSAGPRRLCAYVRHVRCMSDPLNLELKKYVPHRSAHRIWQRLSWLHFDVLSLHDQIMAFVGTVRTKRSLHLDGRATVEVWRHVFCWSHSFF